MESGDLYSSSSASSQEHSAEDTTWENCQGTHCISLSLTTVRLAQTRTPQMSPMKNDLNDGKTQIGKRSIYFLWRDLFTTHSFVTLFFKRINEVTMTTTFSCHIRCDGNCFMCIFVSRCPQYQCVKYLSTGMCLSVHMHKLKSRMEISGVSYRVRFL